MSSKLSGRGGKREGAGRPHGSISAKPKKEKHDLATVSVERSLHRRWKAIKAAYKFRSDSELMKYMLDSFEAGLSEHAAETGIYFQTSTPGRPNTSAARALFIPPCTPVARKTGNQPSDHEESDDPEQNMGITDDMMRGHSVHMGDCTRLNQTVHLNLDGTTVEIEVDSDTEDNISEVDFCETAVCTENTCDAVCDMELSICEDLHIEETPVTVTDELAELQPEDPESVEDDCSSKTRLLPQGYEWDFIEQQDMDKTSPEVSAASQDRIIVDKSCIMDLFGNVCKLCKSDMTLKEILIGGTMVINWKCSAGHSGQWKSCAEFGNSYSINLIIPAAVVTTGNNYSKISLFLKALGVPHVSYSTFCRVQNLCVIPGIEVWYKSMQSRMFTSINSDPHIPIILSGDGRNDSPGHSAQYCSYTLMLDHYHYVLHSELIDKRMTQLKSPNMELEGLIRGLGFLKNALNLGEDKKVEMITDAHPQIMCKLADAYYSKWVVHQLDVWHKANKIGAKVLEAAKSKANNILHDWVPAIRNHFWHCAESCGGDEDLLRTKWQSLLYHVQGIHEWFEGHCSHGPVTEGDHTPLDPESPAIDSLRKIVKDKLLNNSFRFYRNFRHTGRLENFHQVVLAYCSKRISFQYKAMEARVRMAIFDHNHHIHRKPVRKQDGSIQYRRQFSSKGRRWVAVVVKESKDYSYLVPLVAVILQQRHLHPGWIRGQGPVHPNDPAQLAPTIAPVLPADTSVIVALQKSRFGSASGYSANQHS